MADKLTLLELHLHSEDNEFTSDVQLSSDVGELLRDRLGLGTDDSGSDTAFSTDTDDEPSLETDTDADTNIDADTETETSFETDADAGVDPLGADGGDAVETADDEDTGETVVEIDEDVADESDEESSGSAVRKLFVLGLLVGLALAARWYLGGDDLDDEFAVDDEFGVDDDGDDEFEEL